ncbi:MAG: response regulator [Terriglobia bacterium]
MSTSKFRLLIVDDTPSFRDAVSTLLASEGYEVLTADDGIDAMRHLVEPLPDVIISDLHMPHMSGYEFLAVVRQRFPKIRVIAVSSSFPGDELSNAVQADAFLHKGDFTIDELCFKIIELISSTPHRPPLIEVNKAELWVREGATGSLSFVCTSCLRPFIIPGTGQDGGRHQVKCPSCKASMEFQIIHPVKETRSDT